MPKYFVGQEDPHHEINLSFLYDEFKFLSPFLARYSAAIEA
jgi:hypothetical protein